MIDIWLLFNLTLPFVEVNSLSTSNIFVIKVLLQTYIEHLRGLMEESKTINHHGKEIKIDLTDKPTNIISVKP